MSFMRLKLSLKFFIAFLSTSFMIVVIMVCAMQFYAYRNFSDYIHKVEVTRLNELIPLLSLEYRKSNGWERLQDNSYRWHELIKPNESAAYSEKPPTIPSGFEYYMETPRPPLQPFPPPGVQRADSPREGFGRFLAGDRRNRIPLLPGEHKTEGIVPHEWQSGQVRSLPYEDIDIKRSVIYGDKDLLTQVFSNLLENTLRYTDSPGCLTVRSF